jgi:hypothetical protein
MLIVSQIIEKWFSKWALTPPRRGGGEIMQGNAKL